MYNFYPKIYVQPPGRTLKLFLVMKLTTLLLIAGFLQVSARTAAQKISLHEKNTALIQVFEKIRAQSGYDFLVTTDILKKANKVNIDIDNRNLRDVLDLMFKNQPLEFKIMDKSVLVKWKDNKLDLLEKNTSIDIKGRILDEKGRPLVGATIKVKGTSLAVISNNEGYFTLRNVSEQAVLLISFLGYEVKEINASAINNSAIKMELSVGKLQEVSVTTAYGIEKRTKELGYSVAKITGEEIGRANTGNILQGLIGKVSGMNVTAQSSDMNPQMRILLRGIRSFGQSSNNQPLFILNGSPLSFGSDQDAQQQVLSFINNINPADVEDVTILKGANGTAMYGPEGVNGVIIITTKKGVKGDPVINFRHNMSFQQVDYRNDYLQRKFGLGAGNLDEFGSGLFDPTAAYSWGPAYNGSMVPIGSPDENGNYQMVKYEDNKQARKFFNTARINRTNLSISQGDDRSSSYLGLGHTDQTGLLPGDKQNQITVLLNSSRKMGKLTTQVNFNFARRNDDKGPDLVREIRNLPTFIPILSYKDFENDYWSVPDRYYRGISPYQMLDNKRTKTTNTSLSGNLSLEYKPVAWLNLLDRPGITYSGEYGKTTTKPVYFSDYAHTLPEKNYDLQPAVGDFSSSNTSLNNDLILSTIHQINDFQLKTNFGNSIRQNFSKDLRSSATLSVPVYNVSFARFPATVSDLELLSRTISVFGNTLLGYKDRAFLELTGRNEWDSKRAKVARGKDLYFGANTSLVLKDISPYLQKLKWLSNARVRASFALSANMNIAPFQFERRLYLQGDYPYGDLLSYGFGPENPNPLLKPENVFSQEYGLNLGFLDNRFTVDMTYYYQKNNSVILNVKNASLSGAPTTDNAGAFQNSGFELDLKLNPLFSLPNGMALIVDGRFSVNNNKVLKLSEVYKGVFRGDDGNFAAYYARTGNSAYEFAVTDWKRDPQGRVIVDKTTGMPANVAYGDYQISGKTLPKYTASMGFNLSWKGLTATLLMDASTGNDHMFVTSTGFYSGTHPLTNLNNRERFVFPNSSYDDGTGNYVANKDVVVANAGQGLYSLFASVNAHGLVDASFLKVREVSLQYKLPYKAGPIKDITASLYARDLFNFYPKSNVIGDPGLTKGVGTRDFTPVNSNLDGGSSDGQLPGTVLYGFTLSFKF